MIDAKRVLLPADYSYPVAPADPFTLGEWPAQWLGFPGGKAEPTVVAYRLKVSLPRPETVRLHVTADQRYELLLDGVRVGRGSERGDRQNWFFETYELKLPAGEHTLVAHVWWLGTESGFAPAAQVTVRPAFLACAEPPFAEQFSTGRAAWEVKRLPGYTFVRSPFPGAGWFAGGSVDVDGSLLPRDWERGGGTGWERPPRLNVASERVTRWGEMDAPRLRPAPLPPQMEVPRHLGKVRHVDVPSGPDTSELLVEASAHREAEAAEWQGLFRGGSITVPPRTRRRVLVDLESYYCAYPQVALSGGKGAVVRLFWAEALYLPGRQPREKGNRDEIRGKRFVGRGDTFRPSGDVEPRRFDTLWWECGRYLELYVETREEPVTLSDLMLRETRYPLEREGKLSVTDPRIDGGRSGGGRFDAVQPLMWRTLQMCAHESYMDCPYYEQLQYTGDTRLEALVTYVNSRDDRLPRKAIRMFGASQTASGLTQARYPSRSEQIIPQFSLFWVAMLRDYGLWRGDREFLRGHLPRMRSILEVFFSHVGEDGLLRTPEGWDWVDWVPGWPSGQPPRDERRISGINQWQLLMVLGHAADVERWVGEPELAERLERRRRELMRAVHEVYWSDEHGLYADTPKRDTFTEHAQCYALLSGLLPEKRRERIAEALLQPEKHKDVTRGTIYFLYYVFEALSAQGRADALLDRMDLWYGLPELGLKTCLEAPEPSRSDCHAWSSHPLYHGVASLAGIRPREFGFRSVEIAPQPGRLSRLAASVPHPAGGEVSLLLERRGTGLRAEVALPPGIPGVFRYGGRTYDLAPGAARTLDLDAGK